MIRSLLATSPNSLLDLQFPSSSPGTRSSTLTTLPSPSLKPSTKPAPLPYSSRTFPSDTPSRQSRSNSHLASSHLRNLCYSSPSPFFLLEIHLLIVLSRVSLFALLSFSVPIYTRNGHNLLIESFSQSFRETNAVGTSKGIFDKKQ